MPEETQMPVEEQEPTSAPVDSEQSEEGDIAVDDSQDTIADDAPREDGSTAPEPNDGDANSAV